MAYSIRLPDGTLVQNIPDELDPKAAKAKILAARPELGKTERTWGEAAGDLGASAVSGLGSVVQLPGQLYGLATGNFSDTGMLGLGKDIKDWAKEHESEGLKAREAQRDIKVAEAEKKGQLSAFGTSIKETVKDPALLGSFIAEQLPQIIPALLTGGGTTALTAAGLTAKEAAALVASGTAKEAAQIAAKKAGQEAAVKLGTKAAIGTGAVQQGADVGAQAYEDIYKKLISQGASPEQAAGEALNLARAAGASGAIISLLAQRLPGAQTLERALAGGKGTKGALAGFTHGVLGEGVSEMAEETGGQFSQNLAMRDVDPTQSLTQGLGATAGQAFIGGAGMGGGAGAISGYRGEAPKAVPTNVPSQPTDAEAAAQAARLKRAQEQMTTEQGRAARAGEKLLAEEDAAAAKAAKAESKSVAEEIAAQEAAYRAQREEELRAAFPADYSDIMAGADAYANLAKEKAALEKERKTPEIKARIEQLSARMAEIQMADTRVADEIARTQAQQEKIAKKAGFPAQKSAKAMEAAPAQVEMREAMLAPNETLPPQTDLFGKPLEQAPDQAEPTTGDLLDGVPMTTENLQDAGLGPTRAEMKAAGQMDLFGRKRKAAAPTAPTETDRGLGEAVTTEEQPVTEPTKVEKAAPPTPETVPTVVSPDVLGALGIGRTAIIRRAEHGIMGKDITDPAQAAEVKSILEAYKEGRSAPIQEKINAYLARPEFQAAPAAPTSTGATSAGPTKQGGRRARVQAPVQADTGVTTTGTETSERAGVVPTEQNVGQAPAGKGKRKAPVNMFDQLVQKEKTPDAPEVKEEAKVIKPIPEKIEEPKFNPWEVKKGGRGLAQQIEKETKQAKKSPFGYDEKLDEAEARGAEATTNVQAALQEKAKAGDVRGALQAILDAPEGVYNELDKLVAKRLLAAGSLPTLEVAQPTEGSPDGIYDAVKDHVTLYEGSVGSHTLLHELVHGFVHRMIGLHEGGISRNMHVANLRQLYEFVAQQRPDLVETYGMKNLSEFASEAMSNKEFQKELQKLTYRRENAFTAFAKSVLRILGISTTDQNTALGSALISVEAIMGEGRRLQEAAKGTEVEGSLPGLANLEKNWGINTTQAASMIQHAVGTHVAQPVGKLLNSALSGVSAAQHQGGMIEWFRHRFTDKYATIQGKLSQMFSQGVRDAFGNLNPMVLIHQADDHAKMMMDFLREGGIKFNKFGLAEVFKTDTSTVEALKIVDEYAKAQGKTYDEAKQEMSDLLEDHRLHSLLEHNKDLERAAVSLERQGKNKAADQMRDRKINLHKDIADIMAGEAKYQQNKDVQRMQVILNATRAQAIDLMVEGGRISKETGEDWKENSAYVPFDRVMEDMGDSPIIRGRGLAVLSKDPKIKGSLQRPVENTIDAYMKTLGWMVKDAMANNAAVKALETMELGGFAAEIKDPKYAKNKALVVPRLFRDGKPVYFEVQNPYDLAAFQQAPEVMNGFTKFFGAGSRLLRVSITAMPPFAIKQVIEDATRAAMYSGVKRPMVVAMKTLYNLPRAFITESLGKKLPLVKEMEALGIIGDYDFNIYEPASEIEKEIGAKKRGVAGSIFHTLERFTKASDLAARLAVYEETLKETNGDQVLAQTRARELINFNRRGASNTMRTMSRVIPFFNAYAQGMDVLYRAASGVDSTSSTERAAARRLFMSRVAMMTAFGFMYAMAMGDDEGYQNATDDVRDNNWLLPNGYKLPVPKELGFIFKTIPERVMEYVRRAGTDEEQAATDAVAGVFRAALSAYASPTPTPAVIRPLVENMTNYSFFLQRELEPSSMKDREPGYRYTSSTSELAKAIGETTNISPIKIDNALKGLFGMAGSTTLLVTDALINPTRPDRPLYQMPFTNIFLYDTVGGRAKTEFYDLRERVGQASGTFNALLEKDPEKAANYLEKHQALITAAPVVNTSLEQLALYRRMRNMLEQGSEEALGLDSAERRKMIDELRGYENESLHYVRQLEKQLREVE